MHAGNWPTSRRITQRDFCELFILGAGNDKVNYDFEWKDTIYPGIYSGISAGGSQHRRCAGNDDVIYSDLLFSPITAVRRLRTSIRSYSMLSVRLRTS